MQVRVALSLDLLGQGDHPCGDETTRKHLTQPQSMRFVQADLELTSIGPVEFHNPAWLGTISWIKWAYQHI